MRAYLVVGPESSGNRYMTRLLCQAGAYGSGTDMQPFDGPEWTIRLPAQSNYNRIALYRSFPHGGVWVDPVAAVASLQRHYQTNVLVMVRDQRVVELSQVRAGHVHNEVQARHNIMQAYRSISKTLWVTGPMVYMVPYQSLGSPSYMNWILDMLDLSGRDLEPFVDGDAKYDRR